MDPPGACITLALPYPTREAGVISFILRDSNERARRIWQRTEKEVSGLE